MPHIFKIIDADIFAQAKRAGQFAGAEIDLQDGYIHFSTSEQVVETARRHFATRENLMLLAVDVEALGENLKWEASRGGQMFPHLYGTLDMQHVRWAKILLWDGVTHIFPAETFL